MNKIKKKKKKRGIDRKLQKICLIKNLIYKL